MRTLAHRNQQGRSPHDYPAPVVPGPGMTGTRGEQSFEFNQIMTALRGLRTAATRVLCGQYPDLANIPGLADIPLTGYVLTSASVAELNRAGIA